MKYINNIISVSLIAVFMLLFGNSCEKEGLEYKNVYCELFNIKFEGQIGDVIIDRENQTISAKIYSDSYAAIELVDLTISQNATSSIPAGATIDFSNTDTQDLIISAASGGNTKTYTINITKFLEPPFVGNWTISSAYEDHIRIHLIWITSWWEGNHVDAFNLVDSWWNPWGQGDFWSCEWGGDYCYNIFTNGAAISDNTLSMGGVQGVTTDLKMFGEFTYGPGADGEMGSYEHTNAMTWEEYDFNDSYSVLPTNGIWELDLTTNRLVFFNSDRSKSTNLFIAGESEGEFSNMVNNGVSILGNGFTGLPYGWDIVDGKFNFFLEIDRTNLMDQWDAFYSYGVDWYGALDETQVKINGGFALEYRMEKSN